MAAIVASWFRVDAVLLNATNKLDIIIADFVPTVSTGRKFGRAYSPHLQEVSAFAGCGNAMWETRTFAPDTIINTRTG